MDDSEEDGWLCLVSSGSKSATFWEASSNKDIILFIDEIHTLMGAGRAEGVVMDAADIIKPALGRGDITCIGATTIDEYRKYIEKDPALERRFQPILVKEPSPEDTIKILTKLFEARKEIMVEPSSIGTAVDLSVQYIPHRRLPDKAIDILEKACTRVLVPLLTMHWDYYLPSKSCYPYYVILCPIDRMCRFLEFHTS